MSMIVSILENFLGHSAQHYENKSQVNFDCPMCAEDKGLYGGDGKGNLSINYEKGVYKCWACWERNNMHGSVITLIKKYGTSQNLKDYLLIAPKITFTKKDDFEAPTILELPEGFKLLSKSSKYDTGYTQAMYYIKNRGITDLQIERYNIGWTVDGKFKDRIIIPSYDINGNVNYFIARSYLKYTKMKYRNPDARKELVIFNETKINWDSTIYLVEGVFDHIVTPNSIPLLGKYISPKLLFTLIAKAKGNIVIVLDGGKEERADTIYLYKKINFLGLFNKIKVVNIPYGTDLSKIYELEGPKTIIKLLKNAHRLMESRL